jgi:hypothetical protein
MNDDNITARANDIPADKTEIRHPLLFFVRPALVVACLYLLFIALDMHISGHDFLYYVHIGPRYALHKAGSASGYDGQFFYQIARDPLHAAQYLDRPAYRYQRIVYPMLIWALTLGHASLIPFMLWLVNFLAIVLGTELVAHMLVQQKLSPWYSLAFGLYFGQATALIFDTTEPLAYFLVCLGLFLMMRRRPTIAALTMGLAVLSRETAVLFPIGYLLVFLYQKRWWDALRMTLFSIAPALVWYILVAALLHAKSIPTGPDFEHLPFQGLFYFVKDPRRLRNLLLLMFIPTMVSLFLLLNDDWLGRWRHARQGGHDESLPYISWVIWLLNLLLVIFLSRRSYVELVSAGRLSTGLVLAMLFHGLLTRNRTILWASQLYLLTFPYYVIGILAFHLH